MSAHRSRRSSIRLVAVLLTAIASAVSAQVPQSASPSGAASHPAAARLLDSARVIIAKAAPRGDIPALRSAQALLERAATVASSDPWILHYLGFALYREATLSFGLKRDSVLQIAERSDSVLRRAAAAGAIPETHALRSGLLGMMIGSNPLRGMTLGPQASSQMERALELGPANPRVWLVRGIGAFNTPGMFGGGLDRAEEYLMKAITLFATDRPVPPAPGWGAHEAHIWLGQVYARGDRLAEARAQYEKALAIEPEDNWVRMVLMPALDRKQKGQ